MPKFTTPTCIRCGNPEARVTVALDDADAITCNECEETFSIADVEEFVSAWHTMIAWLKAHPARTSD